MTVDEAIQGDFSEEAFKPLAAAVSTCYDTPKEAEENK